MKKILAIAVIVAVCPTILQAQERGHYISVGGGVGQSGFQYVLDKGSVSPKLGYNAGVGYSYFFTPHWGIGTGIQLSTYKTQAKLDGYQASFAGQVDDEGDGYTKLVDLNGWEEEQKAMFAEVPLMLQFQYKFGSKQLFGVYAGAGAKVQIPVSSKYKTTAGSVSTSGYYPQWNVLLYDLPQHGFGTVSDWRSAGDYKLKTSYAATAELGGMLTLSNRLDLLVGGYVDYGLSNIKKEDKGTLVQQDAGGNSYVGLLSSNSVSKANTFSVGGKLALRIRIGAKKSSPQKTVESASVPLPEVVAPPKPKEKPVKPKAPIQNVRPSTEVLLPVQPDASLAPMLKELIAKRINFKLGSAELDGESRALLDEKVSVMKLHPDITLTLVGHTCNLGTYEENHSLGLERADAAKQFMVRRGIAPSRLGTISRYDKQPLVPNTSEENRAQNRRVEFILNE